MISLIRHCSISIDMRSGSRCPAAKIRFWAVPMTSADQFVRTDDLIVRKIYSGLLITPHAIRGGAPLVVSLLTAWITIAVPPLLKTE